MLLKRPMYLRWNGVALNIGVVFLLILQSKMLCLEYVQIANSVFDSIVR